MAKVPSVWAKMNKPEVSSLSKVMLLNSLVDSLHPPQPVFSNSLHLIRRPPFLYPSVPANSEGSLSLSLRSAGIHLLKRGHVWANHSRWSNIDGLNTVCVVWQHTMQGDVWVVPYPYCFWMKCLSDVSVLPNFLFYSLFPAQQVQTAWSSVFFSLLKAFVASTSPFGSVKQKQQAIHAVPAKTQDSA